MTAQDQQSRADLLPCPFCGADAFLDDETGWKAVECTACPAHGDVMLDAPDAIADWNRRAPAEQAARELPVGMEPVAKISSGKLEWNIPRPDYSVDTELLVGSHDLFAEPQILAMGRVPLGFVAVPVEPVGGQSRFASGQEWFSCDAAHVRMVLAAPHEWEGYEVRYVYAQAQPEGKDRA